MHFLLLGEDFRHKAETLEALKSRILPQEARDFDYDVLYGHKLSAEDLKKSLMSLPAVAAQRIVVLHQADKLGTPHKDILLDFFSSGQTSVIVVLESEQWTRSDQFIKKIVPYVSVSGELQEAEDNIFSVTRCIALGQTASALKLLRALLESGEYPLQLMGGLVWFWGNRAKPRISAEKFKKGLLHLQEADLSIKRSRLSPDHALEVLVTRLSLLMK